MLMITYFVRSTLTCPCMVRLELCPCMVRLELCPCMVRLEFMSMYG